MSDLLWLGPTSQGPDESYWRQFQGCPSQPACQEFGLPYLILSPLRLCLALCRTAGAKPLALLTTHRADELSDALALVTDLRSLHVLPADFAPMRGTCR